MPHNETPADEITVTQADSDAADEIYKAMCDEGMFPTAKVAKIIARRRTKSLAAQDALVDALAIRDKAVAPCPADKRSLGDKDCPKCGSSSAGPCWLKVSADSKFVDSVRAALASFENENALPR